MTDPDREEHAAHDAPTRALTPAARAREARTFALTMLVALGALAALLHRRGVAWRLALVAPALGLALCALALAAPAAVTPLRRGWMALGLGLSRVTTPVLLTLVYVLVLVPLRLVLLALGRDPLQRAFEPDRASYWHERARRTFEPRDFERLS